MVHDGNPVDRGTDASHFVVQVESMADTLDVLADHGIEPVARGQERDDGLKTTFIADPDGLRHRDDLHEIGEHRKPRARR